MHKRNTYSTYFRLLLFFLFTVFLQQSCIAQKQEACGPSSCGKITNISDPFRLKQDPPNCGKPNYELACENNNTVLYLHSGRYYVESINYNNFTIRLVDPGVQQTDCSSIPRFFFYRRNLSRSSDVYDDDYLFQHVIYLNCSNRVTDDPKYVDTASCINWNSNGYIYAIAGGITAQRLKVECRVMMSTATSLWRREGYAYNDYTYNESFSYTDIHRALVFGFELTWMNGVCERYCGQNKCSYAYAWERVECIPGYCYTPLGMYRENCGNLSKLRIFAEEYLYGIGRGKIFC
ncbi:hypothetical protein L6164_031679 [Bauhinia variegata]|uniref:Uncharacterized protein n=1 Tax=Bauhinia variegata TaxID=167791 RepID=A0ACB9LGP5_BAUVA|nr:hypothetical protein L6164_031679 [Bauhinia variegata]